MRRALAAVLLLAASLAAQAPVPAVDVRSAVALPEPPPALPPEHFRALRDRLRAAVPDGVILLRGSDKPLDMGAFAQDQDVFYLCGIAEPGIAMLLAAGADGAAPLDELLVPPFSRFTATWEGDYLAPGEKAQQRTGFATVGNARGLKERLATLLAPGPDGRRPVLWTRLAPGAPPGGTPRQSAGAADAQARDPFDGRSSRETALRSQLEEAFPGLEVKDVTPALHALRAVKTDAEIALVRAATEAAAEGIAEAMKSARPGIYEFQLAAVARYVFALRGAGADAYGAIVGAGPNGCVLHYMKNDRRVADGDLIVMDYAPTIRGYASDVTRTFPANGRFSPEQRKLVQDVLDVQQALVADVRPGTSLGELGRKCVRLLHEKGYRSDHGPCHHVGLAVHDVGGDVLQPGMLITVEPGAYLRDQGMGCRIEDVVLVTADGHEVLSRGVPSSPDAIERLMAERGVVDVPVGLPR
jgi:Xaa-Pro aminopeptidase